jgi:SNF2 family DNA or RNA helicase
MLEFDNVNNYIEGNIPIEGPLANQPKDINLPLKKHQLKMLYYMEYFETGNKIKTPHNKYVYTNFGFICDKVGSGKSLDILSLISNNKLACPLNKSERCIYYSLTNAINLEIYEKVNVLKNYVIPLNIIVVPHGVTLQWEKYIKNYTNMSFVVVRNKRDMDNLPDIDIKSLDIILVSSTKYNEVAQFINSKKMHISRLIFDEVDSINIPNCSLIKNNFIWLITSSIQNISWGTTRNLGLLRDIIRSANGLTELQKVLYLKNYDSLVDESLKLLEPIITNIVCKDNMNIKILNGIIDTNIINMINAGAIQDAIQTLHIEQTDETNLISIVCKNLIIELKNKNIELEMKSKMWYISSKAKELVMEGINKKINEIENKIKMIKDRISETNIDPISYMDITEPVITKCCKNKFDITTLALVISKSKECPMCRAKITTNDLIYLKASIKSDNQEESKQDKNDSTIYDKYENLEKLLIEKKDILKKILIFSEYDETFKGIQNILNKNEYKYRMLLGSSTTIQNIVDNYKQENGVNILLLNARHYGSGLNLENTSDIIMFHKMGNDMEKQVIGRAQRLGRKTQLRIWKLINNNE